MDKIIINVLVPLMIFGLFSYMACVPANFSTKTVVDITPTPTSPSPSPTGSPSPSVGPSTSPSASPSVSPSASPSVSPSVSPSASPSVSPSLSPSPSTVPSTSPSVSPSTSPSVLPSISPSVSPSVAPSGTPPRTREVVFNYTIVPADNQVDILLILDDSNSMLSDNLKLGSKMATFVNELGSSGLNWQMCTTTTRTNYYDGKSIYWYPNANLEQYIPSKEVLLPSTPDLSTVFNETIKRIGAGWTNSNDERGVLAMFRHLERRSGSQCYRQEAGLSVILISDENERSVGGNPFEQYYANEYKPLEYGDYPDNYLQLVRSQFGVRKRLAVNSIIVRPEDLTCLKSQDASGNKSHYGTIYEELSIKTQGYVGSICDNDYSNSINYFKERTQNVLSRITLECSPYGNVRVEITPALTTTVQTRIFNNTLVFIPVIPENHTVKVTYQCPI